ncbi:MAG: type II toxin-antitoxin system VapC family toxin [Reyranella sp.]
MIVVDASAMVALLLRTSAVTAIEARLFGRPQTLHAPELIDVEVTQVLRRYSAAGQLDTERGRAVLVDLMDFPMERHPHAVLLQRVWELRHNLSAYDAVYLALAESLDAALLTDDLRLVTAARRHSRVEIL